MAEQGHIPPDEAMLDLLVKQMTEGLAPAEERELQGLDDETLSRWQRDLEQAAAAITLAARSDGAALPPMLASRIAAQAQVHFAPPAGVTPITPAVTPVPTLITPASTVSTVTPFPAPRRRSGGAALGWLAAAACLVLALFGWLRTPPVLPPQIVTIEKERPAPAPPRVLSDAEKRLALIAKPASYKVALAATKDPAAVGYVTGDVVWDPDTQQGYLHFQGLKSNDPAVQQYQAWIFDAGRDARYPVDGGVFDIPADHDEVIIPIRAEVMVHKPAAFAVTVEKVGGAVVSAKDHVVALGKVG